MTSTAPTPNIFDPTAPPQPGVRATESAHRKIELQHPADWTYLIANATRASREKIEKALTASTSAGSNGNEQENENEEEKAHVRARVTELVDEYLRATYDAAKDSVSINGMDAREMEAELAKGREGEELEPFDGKLAQRIQQLSAQVEDQTLLLANLRRKAPKDTAQNFRDSFEARSQAYDQKVKAGEEAQVGSARATAVDVGPIQRTEEMQRIYEKGTEDLDTLKSGLGKARARMERAQRAVEVLEEKPKV